MKLTLEHACVNCGHLIIHSREIDEEEFDHAIICGLSEAAPGNVCPACGENAVLPDTNKCGENAVLPEDTKGRIIATFVPQAWINDYAVEIDDGRVEFDCTEEVLAMGKEKAMKIRDDQYESDHLVPDKILDSHSGPFVVEVAEAIQEYYKDEEKG